MSSRIRKALASTLAIAAACWASSASALDLPSLPSIGISGNYYGGVGFGGSSIEPQLSGSGFSVTDSSDGGTQLFLGRDLSTRISVEGYYANLGAASLESEDEFGRVNYSAFGASGLLYLFGGGGVESLAARRGLNIYARFGGGRVNNEGLGIVFNRNDSWNWSAGFGAEYNLKNGFGLRSEVHTFDTDASVVSFNIVKRFRVKNNGGRFPQFLDKADIPLPKSDKDIAAVKKGALFKKDSDEDGINDRDDLCDSSPEGASVDDYGCDFTGVIEGVSFDTASAKLTEEGTVALDEVITQLKGNDEVKISVQAHTDNRGSAANNMALSRKRAGSVVRYLTDKGKIDLDRITAIGYGESRPRESNRAEAGRLANRRVEIRIEE